MYLVVGICFFVAAFIAYYQYIEKNIENKMKMKCSKDQRSNADISKECMLN